MAKFVVIRGYSGGNVINSEPEKICINIDKIRYITKDTYLDYDEHKYYSCCKIHMDFPTDSEYEIAAYEGDLKEDLKGIIPENF